MTTNPISCSHTALGHLLHYPFCPNQALLKKIANVAFEILLVITLGSTIFGTMLGLGWATHFVISKIGSTTSSELKPIGQLIKENPINTLIEKYPPLGQDAIKFAIEQLAGYSNSLFTPKDLSLFGRRSSKYQPINQLIAPITAICFRESFEKFIEILKANLKDPWSKKDVVQAADHLMKIAYTTSCLTLEDLEAFTEKFAKTVEQRTYARALTAQDSYQYLISYHCPQVYHWIRGGMIWDNEKQSLVWPSQDSKNRSSCFYREGTIEHTWNQLYNTYCDRVRVFATEEELRAPGNGYEQHANWTQKDIQFRTFRCTPDGLPFDKLSLGS